MGMKDDATPEPMFTRPERAVYDALARLGGGLATAAALAREVRKAGAMYQSAELGDAIASLERDGFVYRDAGLIGLT